MDQYIRIAQKHVLQALSKEAKTFALAGGTALELYYLKHRFSWDLDFFSPHYDAAEIDGLVSILRNTINKKVKLESELKVGGRANVRFYSLPVKGSSRPLKIDFVEDVLFKNPVVEKKDGVRVYSVENIYFQKIMAITGTQAAFDDFGRPIHQGRNEARDAFDIYCLSRNVRPLHSFLADLPSTAQKGMVNWYRTFPRQELKLALLDLEIYDTAFNSRDMISTLETEIKMFAKGVLEE